MLPPKRTDFTAPARMNRDHFENEVSMTNLNSAQTLTNGSAGLRRAAHRHAKCIPASVFRSLIVAALALTVVFLSPTRAQDTPPPQSQSSFGAPVSLTLKRAIELALQNSKDIQVAKLQT